MKLQGLWPVERHGLFGFLLSCEADGIGIGRLQGKDSEPSGRIDALPTAINPMLSRGREPHSLSLTDSDFVSWNELHDANPWRRAQSRIDAACSRGMNGLVM